LKKSIYFVAAAVFSLQRTPSTPALETLLRPCTWSFLNGLVLLHIYFEMFNTDLANPYEIVTRIFLFWGIGKYSLYELDSLIVTISDRPNLILGIIISFIVGAFSAVLFYYSLKKLGIDYMLIKCTIIGLTVWAILELVFTATIESKTIPIRPINDYYVHAIGSIFFWSYTRTSF